MSVSRTTTIIFAKHCVIFEALSKRRIPSLGIYIRCQAAVKPTCFGTYASRGADRNLESWLGKTLYQAAIARLILAGRWFHLTENPVVYVIT